MRYTVTFTQYYCYDVETESEDEAIQIAEEEFDADMRRPIAHVGYDDVEVEICEEE